MDKKQNIGEKQMNKTKTRKIAITALSLALVLIASLCLIMAPTNKINVDKIHALEYDTSAQYINYTIKIMQFRAPATINGSYLHKYDYLAKIETGNYGKPYTITVKAQGNELKKQDAFIHGDINSGDGDPENDARKNRYYYGTYRSGEFTYLLENKPVERVCYDGTNCYFTLFADTNFTTPTNIIINFSSRFDYGDNHFTYIIKDNITQEELTSSWQGVGTTITRTTSITPEFDIPQYEIYLEEMYENGIADGESSGYNLGYLAGTTDGYNNGYNEGYLAGSADTENQTYENGVIDGLEQAKDIITEGSASWNAGYNKGSYDVNLELTEVSGNIIGSFGDLIIKLLNFEVAGISMWMILAVIGGIIIVGIAIKIAT